MTALKVLQLVDSEGHPQPVLEELVFAEGDRRRALLRGLLEDYYKPVFELDLARATKNQFHEAFRSFGAREGVLAKCEAFFIQAALAAGIQLSQYILAGRHQGRRRRSSSRGAASGRSAAAPQPVPAQPAAAEPASSPAAPADGISAAESSVASARSTRLSVAEMVLSKYPDFDPSWSAEVQAKWLEGMNKLYEGLAAAERTDGAAANASE